MVDGPVRLYQTSSTTLANRHQMVCQAGASLPAYTNEPLLQRCGDGPVTLSPVSWANSCAKRYVSSRLMFRLMSSSLLPWY